MEELIKTAEKQINRLEEIQFTDVIDTNHTEISKEIRNWCEFIYKLKEKTAQEEQSKKFADILVDQLDLL